MRCCHRLPLLTVAMCCGAAVCQEKGALNSPAVEPRVNVDVFLAKEHVPAGLKAGTLVDLTFVAGKTVTAKGRVSYMTKKVAPSVIVVSIAPAKKPKSPEYPILATLSVTQKQLPLIERMKTRSFTVSETKPGGGIETKQMFAVWRLEIPAAPIKK